MLSNFTNTISGSFINDSDNWLTGKQHISTALPYACTLLALFNEMSIIMIEKVNQPLYYTYVPQELRKTPIDIPKVMRNNY